ncbi:MAG: hypothetical protein A2087_05775 [Spirochaetes bacterium GWD1_61_31]|nr:MAG: hypothetical protein A2Y37_13635 [Spirochaetes bacterium GWB1_60_80]OHD31511.1 MAG: hypothetical protein A2004_13260 [Spirochaetes bacterium GWC1_61_12]OHD43288.1 MAG: hypothetical protein A2087_05775 [Spirochaetes bacterium GWD1_61_31]OHD45622.1 MAG: hypothetical protein A2Y35_09215 [Spirochaetes bacterium GWE1_60_18]OHD60473.1 MAG: hypothetical protein A2Y32_02905 [Spirochaetes bacterium GWF1_60_12]HAP44726.1 bifunctional oligoribonuclease/PAP phosphatase NrnA [Spirochaetaceae bacter
MSFDEALAYFQSNDHFLISTHESPDADGLGAQYALCRGLTALGKQAVALNSDAYSAKYSFIDPQDLIQTIGQCGDSLPWLASAHLVLLDTNDIHYAGQVAAFALAHKLPVFIIDHHELEASREISGYAVMEASSCCELIFELLKALGIEMQLDMAKALFAGIVYDTGSFSYSKTRAGTFQAAMEMVTLGVQPEQVHAALYESSSIQALLLKKNVLSTLELHRDNSIAIQTMTQETLIQSGASYIDAEDLINIPLQTKSVAVSILFKETDAKQIRCSLRAKGQINVAAIAQTFGGGGHKNAAGFKSTLPLADLKSKMLSLLQRLF